jgi:hypothetical protein
MWHCKTSCTAVNIESSLSRGEIHFAARSKNTLVNRYFSFIELVGGKLWNRLRLDCDFNQSAFMIRPTRCINNNKYSNMYTTSSTTGADRESW